MAELEATAVIGVWTMLKMLRFLQQMKLLLTEVASQIEENYMNGIGCVLVAWVVVASQLCW